MPHVSMHVPSYVNYYIHWSSHYFWKEAATLLQPPIASWSSLWQESHLYEACTSLYIQPLRENCDNLLHTRNIIYTHIIASELVDWFVSSGEAETREQAVELGQLLINTDYIHHVVDEHNFEDAYLFFRFRQDGELTLIKRTLLISLRQLNPAGYLVPSLNDK